MNYITLQGRVEDELNRADLSTQIQTWINEARGQISDGTLPVRVRPAQGVHRFSWTYTSTVVSTSAQNNDWPSDFIEEINLFTASPSFKPLVKVDPSYFIPLLYGDDGSTASISKAGTPTNYIDRGSSYDLYPAISSATDVYLQYYGYPTDLAANGDEYEIDTQVPALIIYTSCLIAAQYMHDIPLKNDYKELCADYYNAAVNKDRMKKWKNKSMRMKTFRDFSMDYWKGLHQTGEEI